MTTLAAPSHLTTPRSSLRSKAVLALCVLAGFGAYSVWVVALHGYTGFLALAAREPWAMQMLLDLVIACAFGIGWMVADARKHGIATWPYLVTTLLLGSVGLLAYVVRRGLLPTAVRQP